MSARVYTSAVQRLQALPELFTGSDLTMVFGWSSQTASTYLANWRRAGWVQSLGGRSDVHMNLVLNRNPNIELAVRRVFPTATRIGVDVLREAGWTTQIIQQPEVAIEPGTRYHIEFFQFQTRSARWFALTRPGTDDPALGLRRLRPAWALCDMIARAQDRRVHGAWLLDADDLDLEAARSDTDMPAALQAFGLNPHCLSDAGYPAGR